MRFNSILLMLLLLATIRAAAQLAPRSIGSCPVSVAFEPLVVQSLVGISNQYHAIVLIGGDAFEANPSGNFRNWGSLVGRWRNLRDNPLKDGHIQREAGLAASSCSDTVREAEAITKRVNAAKLPYSPAPELNWNSANSNSFAHYLVRKLGLWPPPPPWPPAYGFVPGYHDAIQD